jgi:hypothetical protein
MSDLPVAAAALTANHRNIQVPQQRKVFAHEAGVH